MNRRQWYGYGCFVAGIVIAVVSIFKPSLFAPIVSAMYICTGNIIVSREDGDA